MYYSNGFQFIYSVKFNHYSLLALLFYVFTLYTIVVLPLCFVIAARLHVTKGTKAAFQIVAKCGIILFSQIKIVTLKHLLSIQTDNSISKKPWII